MYVHVLRPPRTQLRGEMINERSPPQAQGYQVYLKSTVGS